MEGVPEQTGAVIHPRAHTAGREPSVLSKQVGKQRPASRASREPAAHSTDEEGDVEIAVSAPESTGRQQSPPPRVLIVDDDAAIRLLCSINLQLAGVAVVEATDAWVGLAQARAEPPDLIVTDVKMPGLDGFAFAEALRRDRRTRAVPVVFLSGEARKENESRAKALGALAYVTKPFDPTTLTTLVTGILRSGQAGSPEPEAC